MLSHRVHGNKIILMCMCICVYTLDLGLVELHNLQLVFSKSFSIIYIYINIYNGEMFYSFPVIYHVGDF